jgi:hypothetical protein
MSAASEVALEKDGIPLGRVESSAVANDTPNPDSRDRSRSGSGHMETGEADHCQS